MQRCWFYRVVDVTFRRALNRIGENRSNFAAELLKSSNILNFKLLVVRANKVDLVVLRACRTILRLETFRTFLYGCVQAIYSSVCGGFWSFYFLSKKEQKSK